AIPDSSYYHYREAQMLYDALGNQYNSGRMLYNMAAVQTDVKDYTGSEITTIKAIELLKPLDKYKQLYQCYNNLGIVSLKLNEYDLALENYEEAFSYLNKFDDTDNAKETVLNNIGLVYLEKRQYQKAITYFDQVLKTKDLLNKNATLYATALNNYANCKLKLDDIAEVKEHLDRALQIRDSIGDIVGVSTSNYNLVEYHLRQKDTSLAILQAQKAKTYSEQSSNNERLLETLKLLAVIDAKNSVVYTQNYIALNDSLQREERRARDKFTRIRFETNETLIENQTLTKKKQVWTGIAVGLLLAGTAFYIIVDQRIKNQTLRFQQQQQASNQEIFNLLLSQKQKVEEGKQLEQKRISE
ncbi:MAG: tetratricopeptide repeat protein, partial [Maribacter sp.]